MTPLGLSSACACALIDTFSACEGEEPSPAHPRRSRCGRTGRSLAQLHPLRMWQGWKPQISVDVPSISTYILESLGRWTDPRPCFGAGLACAVLTRECTSQAVWAAVTILKGSNWANLSICSVNIYRVPGTLLGVN